MDTKPTKLHQLQCKVEVINKDATGSTGKRDYKYFDINTLLAALKPLLKEIGITITQPLDVFGEKNALTTYIYDSETGDELAKSSIILPDNIEPQKMGSAITYYRRYSLQSMLLLEAEDDDGNSTKTAKDQVTDEPSKPASGQSCVACGDSLERYEGVSAKNNKAYIKFTCNGCRKVTWG